MAAKRKTRAREAQLAFEALSIEGGLLSPEWLSKVAQLQAGHQADADYRIHKGLNLRDEIGRYWRIAQAHWADFKTGREAKADPKTLADRFVPALLRDALGFASLVGVPDITLHERTYPVGHAALGGRAPIVVAPADGGLDTLSLSFGDGGRRRSAFGLAQEYLNAQEDALWGIASDGVSLRIVRDNASLTRPAWIEADLQRIFSEDRYADFAALWLLCHESRFGREGQPVTECALEAWRLAGREEGTRAREHLRRGVEEALVALGQGFLSHPENVSLRAELQNGTLPAKDYFNQLLRLVYRLIFLLTVEERGLLHPEGTSDETKALFANGYGIRHLRERSVKRSAHDRFCDLWEATKVVCRGLGTGEPRLGLPALAGIFAASQCAALDGAKLENRALLLAVFKLAWLREDGSLARVNWRDMGPEELGSVYESLLELVPQITKDGRQFAFATGGETKGNARKTTGSYYTPDSLVQVLLDSALEPVIADTIAKSPSNAVEALLGLSIVDPACGSGHFLLAAARRLASHVARFHANGTPSAAEYRHALRQVVGRCIFGVDLNAMAVELCKVGLWMEAVEPGLPLTFLNSHIQHGNALIGTTPELMSRGVPDAAWDPIDGDDKKTASALKKRNKKAAEGQRSLDTLWTRPIETEALAVTNAVTELDAASDANVEALARKEERWDGILGSPEYRHQKFVADAWCATFVWPKLPGEEADAAPTNELWRQVRDSKGEAPALTSQYVRELASQYRFFHWHLQFPQVFAKGGFDVVLGNPPWDTLSPDRREFFSRYRAGMRSLSPDEQGEAIDELLADVHVASAWNAYQRELLGLVLFLKESGRFTLYAEGNLGKGDFNVYRSFTELGLRILRTGGYEALVLPAGIYGGANASAIRKFLFDSCEWVRLWGMSNSSRGWFRDVDMSRFAAISVRLGGRTARLAVQFGLADPKDLLTPTIPLDADAIRQNAPDTYAIPEVRSIADVSVAAKMVGRHPAFGNTDAPPPLRHYQRELDMGNDRELFGDKGLPVYEGRMVGQYDHRAKTYASGHGNSSIWIERAFNDPQKLIVPQWRIAPRDIPPKLGTRYMKYRLGFRDVAQPRDVRSLIATLLPPHVVCGDKVPTIDFPDNYQWAYLPWLAVANSFVMDWMVRSKLSSAKVSFTLMDSLPFPRPQLEEDWVQFVSTRVLRLVCTAPEMTPFWNAMAALNLCNQTKSQVPEEAMLNEAEREKAQAEIDAVIARDVYGLSRDEFSDVLDTFPVVARRDLEKHGQYRTKRITLEAFDVMSTASRTGAQHESKSSSAPREGGKVLRLPVRSVVSSAAPAPWVVPDLTALGVNAWARPHMMERGEIQAAIVAVLKVSGVPMHRGQARLASLLCLEPHLLTAMLDKAEKDHWSRVVGSDAKKTAKASIDGTAQEWGAALAGLRGRERLLEDLQLDTWALGKGTEAIDTSGWPEGRAGFVVNVLRRLQQAKQVDAIILKLPTRVQQWLADAA